ncbi:hypothetical protein [Demequina mangrovi]|uniref:Uncharacterized protein n=1 Tax=Demequina mangrovi TaxID=1043493 RepID=A0A1H6WUE7_9MICO|nr:hypothetical protein [Demequina mangrovi]SEJ17887.1 hypothetical protein SAMN05421637_1059 [Demequina mangrovi]
MSTDTLRTRPRRGIGERVTGVIWGAIVATTGGLLIAALSGYTIDVELAAIIALSALGAWLVVSAVVVATRQSRRERAAFEAAKSPGPEPEEPAMAPAEPTGTTGQASTEPEDRKDP